MTKPLEITARYRSTVWAASDGSCVIARVTDERTDKTLTVKGPPDCGPALVPGLGYRWFGRWSRHDQYGEQFEFAGFAALAAPTREGTVRYLAAVAEGVGESRAVALWAVYGPLAVEALRNDPDAVAAAGVMPLAAARAASESLSRERAWEPLKVELYGLLGGRGFQMGAAIAACLTRWGARAPDVVRRNPYALLIANVPSAGWARCDRLYLDLGHPAGRLKRQALVAAHHLREQAGGDTWLPAEAVCRAVEAACGKAARPERALVLARRAGLVRVRRDGAGGVWLAERGKAVNEAAAAAAAKELALWTQTESSSSSPSPSPNGSVTGGW